MDVKGEYGSASPNAKGLINFCGPEDDGGGGGTGKGGLWRADGDIVAADSDEAAEMEMASGSAAGS